MREGLGTIFQGPQVLRGKHEEVLVSAVGFPNHIALVGFNIPTERQGTDPVALDTLKLLKSLTESPNEKAQEPRLPPSGSKVFLSHNSVDKPEVRRISQCLKSHDIFHWLDELELGPGCPLVAELEEALEEMTHCIMCLGPKGMGPWQRWEYEIAVVEEVAGRVKMLPLQLAGGPFPNHWPPGLRRLRGQVSPWSCNDFVEFVNS